MKKRNNGENVHRSSQSLRNKGKEVTGTLNKPTPISEQLSIIKTLSALDLDFLFKSALSSAPFEIMITNAVNM